MSLKDKINDWYWGDDSNQTRSAVTANTLPQYPGSVPPSYSDYMDNKIGDSATSIDAVYRSLDIISGHLMQMKPVAFNSEGIRLTSGGAVDLVRKPDSNRSVSSFLKRTGYNLAATGNAFWLVRRNTFKDVVDNVVVLETSSVSITFDKNGAKKYRVGQNEYSDFSRFGDAVYSIKHLRKTEVEGSVLGYGPIQMCAGTIKGIQKVNHYGDDLVDQSARPTGVLSFDAPLTQDELLEAKGEFIAGQKTRTVAVVSSGGKYVPTIFSAEDAQYIENQKLSTQKVARLFGLPATWLLAEVGGNSLTYSNMEQVKIDYLQNTLMHYIIEIEEAFSDITPTGSVIKMDTDVLLRPDRSTRTNIHKAEREAGYKTVNEIRIEEGLQPLEGGDVLAAPTPVTQPEETPTETEDTDE